MFFFFLLSFNYYFFIYFLFVGPKITKNCASCHRSIRHFSIMGSLPQRGRRWVTVWPSVLSRRPWLSVWEFCRGKRSLLLPVCKHIGKKTPQTNDDNGSLIKVRRVYRTKTKQNHLLFFILISHGGLHATIVACGIVASLSLSLFRFVEEQWAFVWTQQQTLSQYHDLQPPPGGPLLFRSFILSIRPGFRRWMERERWRGVVSLLIATLHNAGRGEKGSLAFV